jgi:hypothetical protein
MVMGMNTTALKVKAGLKAGRLSANHVRSALRVKAGVKAGKLAANHARSLLATRG